MRKIEAYQVIVLLLALSFLIASLAIESSGKGEHFLLGQHAWAVLAAELGFALFISFVVSVGIERRARALDNAAYERMRKSIADDVFRGVFAENLPRHYVDAVVDRDLKVSLVRPWIKTTNNVVRLSSAERKLVDSDGLSILRINRTISARVRNISGSFLDTTLRVYMPVAHPALLDSVLVDRIEVDGNALDTAAVKSYRREEREQTTVCYEWPISLVKGGEATVVVDGRLYKFFNDNDIFAFHAPAFRYEVIFNSEFPLERLGLFERSAAQVTGRYVDLEKGFGMWTLEGPILPNDSITMWWRFHENGEVPAHVR